MAIFMSDAELQREGTDVGTVVARAEAYIVDLQRELETQKARADAAAINVEQTCGLIEQKFLSLTDQYSQLEQQKEQTTATLERRSGELAQAQAQTHRLELEAIKRDAEVERLSFELSELKKSKRELLDVVDHKNSELDEKNSSIKSYLDKIVALTDDRSTLESKLHEHEAEVTRLRASQTRLAQEKELLSQHNAWINEELSVKVATLLEERRTRAETEAELRTKLAEAERRVEELGEAARRHSDRNKELEAKLAELREDCKFAKEDASAKVEHLSNEIATATKLADLYKESSDEWSKKSHDLEGVITALKGYLNQLEVEHNSKLDEERTTREAAQKEVADYKQQLEKVTSSEGRMKEDYLALTTVSTAVLDVTNDRQLSMELHEDGSVLPPGLQLSGTALAASLLRDGWSIATMYSKYQEAVDKWRHEKQARHYSDAILQKVLHEIESKTELILDERAEHERMIRAYTVMEGKLRQSMADQVSQDNIIKDLKAELRKKERDLKGAGKEVSDLQTQVSVLLKECADIQKRLGAGDEYDQNGNAGVQTPSAGREVSNADAVISSRLVTFKDIRGVVEQNSQLRTVARNLAQENEQKEALFKETFEIELQKRTEKLVQKVSETVEKLEQEQQLRETLQATVRMYKTLFEETNASRNSQLSPALPLGDGGEDMRRVLSNNQVEIQKLQDESAARIKALEAELEVAKQEVINSRVEQARADGAGSFAKEQLESQMKDFENQRKEMESLLRRNMEYSQTITDYQRKLRENAQSVQTAEENARKLSIEVSVLEREKDLLADAEKRASDEVASLSDRVHRLQATLDTVESVKAFQENMRVEEVKRLETELNRMQKEWAEARRDLESERLRIGSLTSQRDQSVNQALDRVDSVCKELTDALKALSTAETRAQVAEARCINLEASLKKAEEKVAAFVRGRPYEADEMTSSTDEEMVVSLQQARDELEKVKEDLIASRGHTDQYKRIATANEEALKQMEEAHTSFKEEAERVKAALESQISSLRRKLLDLEAETSEREKAAALAMEEKEVALRSALNQLSSLKEVANSKQSALDEAEERIGILKKDGERVHHQWREAQNNYERQVLLQADTIRELTSASEKLMQLEEEVRQLRGRAETAESDLASSKVSWAMQQDSLVSLKSDMESKLKEVHEQNQLLLDRLEARHVMAAEQAQKKSEESGDTRLQETQAEPSLQSVIRFLRRSKETSDTELSLMKQERLRLQKQLDAALRAAEDAQTSLRRERENARANLHTDQDLKSLQAQVKELDLLRESNAQLREENQKSFEDSKDSREKAGKAQAELEAVQKQLRDREVDLEAAGKDLEVQKAEAQRWQNRVSQLLEKYRSVDVEDYQRVKGQLSELQAQLSESKEHGNKLQEKISSYEQDITLKQTKIAELEKKVQELTQSEGTFKNELERYRRHAAYLKKKIETLTREKDDLSKEIDSLSKQVEELKANAGRKAGAESTRSDASQRQEAAARQEASTRQEQTDNLMREQDVRIQTLERTLERERDELRKERLRRQKDHRAFNEIADKAVQEKKRFLDEFHSFKQDLEQNGMRGPGLREPITQLAVEDRAQVYEAAVGPLASLASGVSLDATLLQVTPVAPAIAATTQPQSTGAESFVPVLSVQPAPPASSVAAITAEPIATAAATILPSAGPATQGEVGAAVELASFNFPILGESDAGISAAPMSIVHAEPQPLLSATSLPSSGVSTAVSAIPSSPLVSAGVIPAVSASRPSAKQFIQPPRSAGRGAGSNAPAPPSAGQKEDLDMKIQQLRAHLLEKEKAQAQARKMTRKLVRPRIEPEVQVEQPELVTEGQLETAEMDTDSPDRRAAISVQDASEPPLASSDNAGADSVLEPSTVDETTVASQLLGVGPSVARKRTASMADAVPQSGMLDEYGMAVETVPASKRARPDEAVELPSTYAEAPNTTSGSREEALQTVREDVVQLLSVEGVPTMSDPPVESNNFSVIVTESIQIESSTEVDRERPVSDLGDIPALKKQRTVWRQLVATGEGDGNQALPLAEPIPAITEEHILAVSGEGEYVKPEAGLDAVVPVEIDNAVEKGNQTPGGNGSPHGGSQELVLDVPMKDIQPDEMQIGTQLPPVHPVNVTSTDTVVGVSSVDPTGAVGDFQLIVALTAEPSSKPQDRDLEEGALLEGKAALSEAGAFVNQDAEKEGGADRDEDTEDGELMTDAEGIAEGSHAAQQETGLASEGREAGDGDVPSGSEAANVPVIADTTGKVPNPASALPVTSEAGQVSLSGEQTDLQRQARQAPRGGSTTINLAERARQRAEIRRKQNVSPPSPGPPGGRGRGSKRGAGPGRGRVISTGVRNQGQSEAAQGVAAHGAQADGAQTSSTSNTHEAVKDEHAQE